MVKTKTIFDVNKLKENGSHEQVNEELSTSTFKEGIGCCGAYCKNCIAYSQENLCRGCKLEYKDGKRDIGKEKCKIKICCIWEKQLETCADCGEFSSCELIQGLYGENVYKYKKYQQSLVYQGKRLCRIYQEC